MDAHAAYVAKQQEVMVIGTVIFVLFVCFIVWLSNRSDAKRKQRWEAAMNSTPSPNGMVARVTSLRNFILQRDNMYSPSFSRQISALRKGQFKFNSLAFEMMRQLAPHEVKYLEQLMASPQEKEVLSEFAIQYRRWLDKSKLKAKKG